MTAALACGALFGLGVVVAWLGMRPRTVPLAEALARLDGSAAEDKRGGSGEGGLAGRVGPLVVEVLSRFGLDLARTRRDLEVSGKSMEAHAGTKAGVAIFGALLAPGMAAVMALGGVFMPSSLLVTLSAGGGVLGFIVPDLLLKAQAEELRDEARRGLGAFLDLAVIVLAGGGGVQTALERAAYGGDGWVFNRIRAALESARAARSTPWAALAQLGERLGVTEFGELAASVALAGTEGARVRESLVAKAASLRSHELAAAESKAASATEAMSAPVALLAVGFVLFLAFPAVMAVLAVS